MFPNIKGILEKALLREELVPSAAPVIPGIAPMPNQPPADPLDAMAPDVRQKYNQEKLKLDQQEENVRKQLDVIKKQLDVIMKQQEDLKVKYKLNV